jgi:hypothetical protein
MAAPHKRVTLLYYYLQYYYRNNEKPYTKKVGLILLVKPISKANLKHQPLLYQPIVRGQAPRSSRLCLGLVVRTTDFGHATGQSQTVYQGVIGTIYMPIY